MKSTTYIAKITTQKNEKYLLEREENQNPLACSSARLLTSCQLRNFPLEFTEKCFAVFDQSRRVVYLTWYWPLFFFPGIFFYQSFYSMTSRFQSNQGEGVHFHVYHHLLTFSRSNFFQLKARYLVFNFLDLDGTILNLIKSKMNKKR